MILSIETPTSPPSWALLERELIRAQTLACEEFFERYFDERGYLICVPRWGGDDGPDDAIENLTRLVPPPHPWRSGCHPEHVQEGVGGSPPSVYGSKDRGCALRQGGIVQALTGEKLTLLIFPSCSELSTIRFPVRISIMLTVSPIPSYSHVTEIM